MLFKAYLEDFRDQEGKRKIFTTSILKGFLDYHPFFTDKPTPAIS